MKKLLSIAAMAMALAACSSQSDNRPHPPQGQGPHGAPNPQVEAALKACHESVGQTRDQAKFDACMKEKGFERPQGPNAQAPDQSASNTADSTTSTVKKAVKKSVKKATK